MMPYSRHLRATSNPIRAVTRLARTVVWTVLAVSISSGASAAPLTFTDSGALAADIQDTVDAFRTTLGALNANLLPPDFFNVNSPRGSVYSTPGSRRALLRPGDDRTGVRHRLRRRLHRRRGGQHHVHQLFDRQDDLIASVYAPAAGAGSLSFAGFFDTDPRIGRVRIPSGEVPLGSRLLGDRVAMDDFIYAEPVPEPATLTLLGAAVAAVVARGRRH